MNGARRAGRGAEAVCAALALAVLALLIGMSIWLWQGQRRPLLLAPAIGGLNPCLDMSAPSPSAPLRDAACIGPQGSAAGQVEAILSALGPRQSPDGRLRVGYTLVVPLLNLFRPDTAAAGGWRIDEEAVQRVARTVQGVDRPVVLYLFSSHFSEGAPIEPVLAADPANLAQTPRGPLPVDHYMGLPMYPWSVARTDNPITQRRDEAIGAVSGALCQLPAATRQRLAGINLLGETHQLYPDFETGMGTDQPYVVTDYSPTSRAGFAAALRQRFGTVAALNRYLGSSFADFAAVQPPSRDIRRERLDNFWQHIDDAAAGSVAVSGWVHDGARAKGRSSWVRIYLDGQWVGRVPARFERQDVAQARPELGTARLGWRYDLRFADLPLGRHRLDVALEGADSRLQHLGTRHINVMGRDQLPPQAVPMRMDLPPMQPVGRQVAFWIDAPQDERALFYNPLVPLWDAFRAQQVVRYLEHFDRLLAATCLADVPRRTQQIYPAEKAGWDASRFAAGASLLPFGRVQLGINLYGEATDDASFFDWLARSRQSGYSVTEFHPLRGMSAAELGAVFEDHRRHGARTLSFFLHPVAPGEAPANPFAFDPHNPRFGSDRLYAATQALLR
ncbi:MAG: hypothetical protein R3E52_13095 [Burkholderiaceae bacterium]